MIEKQLETPKEEQPQRRQLTQQEIRRALSRSRNMNKAALEYMAQRDAKK